MQQTQAAASIESDVLHNENHSKLTSEEIAKALAHHKKHHHDDQPAPAGAKVARKAK
ncbi:MAG: hypothetical protein P4L40_15995 [Terracidiphilus sp.]|nr:hypothetical protein [Terracidiphilus sp.]